MRIIQPTAKIYWDPDPLKHMEYCGRVCYNSYKNMKDDSAEKFLDGLIKRGHFSVLEHAAVNINAEGFQLSLDKVREVDPEFGLLMARANLGSLRYADMVKYDSRYATAESLKDLPRATDMLTFEVTASRSCTHQFVRHRNMSFSERSLRFVKLDNWDAFEVVTELPEKFTRTEQTLRAAWEAYNEALQITSADEARALLPMCTATKLMATAQATWWVNFLALRYHPAASNEIIKIARQIYDQCPEPVKAKIKELQLEEQFGKADEKCKQDLSQKK